MSNLPRNGEVPAAGGEAGAVFRLTGPGATLYKQPEVPSAPLAKVQGGALIVLVEMETDFLLVQPLRTRCSAT